MTFGKLANRSPQYGGGGQETENSKPTFDQMQNYPQVRVSEFGKTHKAVKKGKKKLTSKGLNSEYNRFH